MAVVSEHSPAPRVDEAALLARVRRGARRESLVTWSARIGLLVLLLLLWQVGAARLGDFWIASPAQVLGRIGQWVKDGSLLHHIGITCLEMVTGLVIGGTVGILVGVLLARSALVARILDPFIVFLFALPHIALGPLLIMWLGIGLKSKLFLVGVTAFFFLFFNTFSGVRSVNPELIHASRIMGATPWQLMRKVLLPSAILWIFTGLRMAIRQALAAAVIGEMIAASAGLGWLINTSSGTFDTTGVFVGLLAMALVAGVLYFLAGVVESKVVHWQ